MSPVGAPSDTAWIDQSEYPFSSHMLDLEMGRMHYLDEGQGRPLLMVHGTPTWSFLYRHLVRALAPTYRCIVPDHIGFGLSDKPPAWSYRPEDHARNLRALIEHLDLRDITLIVHDFGGPIGLSYAIEQPENVRSLVLFNTWMWSLRGNRSVEMASRVMGSAVGRWLYKQFNISPRMLIPSVMGDKSKLTKPVHQHYIRVVPRPADRQGMWVLARELIGSSTWYDQLWQQRTCLADKPALLLWGMRDPTFPPNPFLGRWKGLFSQAQVVTFDDAGHFVQEEGGERLLETMRNWLDAEPAVPAPQSPD
jgi:haloalkane dehalogenase